jgi:hypothetical protein
MSHASKPKRSPIIPVVILAISLPSAPAALAGSWQGTVEMRDGVEYVMNPKEPMEAPATIVLQEKWRIGGDSEEEGEFFGVIVQMTMDPEGNIYLLDQQLSEVKVFSPEGVYLHTMGREGEGPGEFRRPQDLFFVPDGNLGVLQLAPGRIVMLSPEGEPMGDHPLPENEGGASPTLMNGQKMGDNLALVFSENTFYEGRMDINRFLALVDPEGVEKKRMLESVRQLEFVDFQFDEKVWRTFDDRWKAAPDGKLFACETFQDYAVTMWDPAGNRKRVITREYDRPDRTQDQKDEMYNIFDGFLQDQLPQYSIKISDHDPDISDIFPREDGTLWVMSSRGMRFRPDGAIGVFDIFDSDGRYLRQLTLMGEGTPLEDVYFFLGNRIFVVTGLLDAQLASHGGRKGEEAEGEEPEPIEVICYEVGGERAQAEK